MSRSLVLFLAALAAVAVLRPSREAAADSRPLPEDLALVPSNAVGFAHIRAAELWKREDLKPYREIVERAGSKAFAQLDEHFEPKPSTTDRVTLVLLPKGKGASNRRAIFEPFEPALILHFDKPYDRERVLKAHAEKSKVKTAGGKDYYLAEKSAVAIAFTDSRTLVLGDDASVAAILSAERKDGPLTPALRAAVEKPIAVGVNVVALPIPAEVLAQIPDEYKPLTEISLISGTIDLAKEPVVDLKLTYPNVDAAVAGEKALRKLATLGRVLLDVQRKELQAEFAKVLTAKKKPVQPIGSFPEAALAVAGLGGLNVLDDFLANPPIALEGASLTAKVKLPEWTSPFLAGAAISAGVGLPGVQKVREAAESAVAMNNLKQIGLALHNYHDVHNAMPPAAILGKKGKKLLSWRVAILPYMEQDAVYRQFKLDEPWDSEHNKKFSDVSIKSYMDPRAELKPGQTNYRAFVGDAAMFDAVKGRRFVEVTDGLSNTLMVMAGGDPVPWAKPDDFDYDPTKEFPADYAKAFDDALLVLFADGSVRSINLAKLADRARVMKLLIERNDGMVIPNIFD